MRVLLTGLAVIAALTGSSRANGLDGLRAFRAGQIAEALDAWDQGAAQGDADSLLCLGAAYDTGSGVPQDFERARTFYERSASRGNASAALDVGLLYDSGRGVTRSPAAAARWYDKAAKLGSGRAAYNLGTMRERGEGVRRDVPGAIAAYRRASALGVPAARRRLAALGQTPREAPVAGPHDDPTDGFAETRRALLRDGLSSEAVSHMSAAAAKGDARAAFDLGYAYEHGLGVPVDNALAVLWYGEAAKGTSGGVAELAKRSLDRLLIKVHGPR